LKSKLAVFIGASSCSSGSVDDENEDICYQQCCLPQGCPNGEDAVADERMVGNSWIVLLGL